MSEEAIVLAAGKGTRMRSSLPKVLHSLAGKPILVRVLNALADAGFERPAVVIGYGAQQIQATVGDRCRWVVQDELLGTGHAARLGLESLPARVERVMIVHGDEPLIVPETYSRMLDFQREDGAPVVLLTTHVADTRGFGRVIRDGTGKPAALLQESELSPEQRLVTEVNLGAYVFDTAFLRRELDTLEPHSPKDEYFLTDVVQRAYDAGTPAEAIVVPGGEDLMGINDLVRLEEAGRVVYRQTAHHLMYSGVTIVDTASTFVDEDARIEPDTIIEPFTVIAGAACIGRGSIIGPGARIVSSRVGARCRIISSTIVESDLADDVTVGPYAHLRAGSKIGARAEIGTAAEIKASTLGPRSRLHHFSYLGDAQVGSDVNIGAGSITCNYDGSEKHETVIEDGAFIGSDTLLRAPIRIGKGAYTGAGSVVTKDVPDGARVAGVPARPLPSKNVPPPESGSVQSELASQRRREA